MKRITKPILVFLAIAAICVAGFQALNSFTDYKALPVTSNFMQPTISNGSLVIMHKTPEKDLKPGDIIAVGLPAQESHSVGRLIQSSQMADGYYNLTFKGDNRTLPESFPYTVKDSTYLHKFSIPVLGFLFVFLSSPFGLILFGAASIVFAWYYLFKMHDRMTWAERTRKHVAYRKRVAQEQEEERKHYKGLDALFPLDYDDEPEADVVSEVDGDVSTADDDFDRIISPSRAEK